MSIRCFRFLALPLLSLSLIAIPVQASSGPAVSTTNPISPVSSTASSETYDQIVRLSLVEGDVRISRGKEAERATGGAWGVATANLPIESGFSLVTGKGRTEIEFEDASTVYLDDNSVLIFDQITTTGGVPYTQLTLLSGTATLHVEPTLSGESFILNTATGGLLLGPGVKAYVRINSYLDAVAVTPQEDSAFQVNNTATKTMVKGQTTTYYADSKLAPVVSSGPDAFAEWDEWTARRVAIRDAAVSAMMKESGLTSPIPGIAEMIGQGTFFDCAPYGTCWEPTGGWGPHEAETGQLESTQISYPPMRQSSASASLLRVSQTLQSAGPGPIVRTEYDDEMFPCGPGRVRRMISTDPLTGRETVLRTDYLGAGRPYDWAVCHAGSWIHQRRHYVWVAGTKRHHRCPIRWVKYGRAKAYVPIHPRDVAGKPPLNLKHGVFEPTGKKGESVERVAFDPSTRVKVLNSAPKQFLAAYYPPLQHAETPRPEAHFVRDGIVPGRTAVTKSPGSIITFDHKSQSFMVARQQTVGTRATTVTERFGGRASGSGGGSALRAGGGSFGSHGPSSGGGSHGSAGGGGGSHGAGGGGGGFSGGGGSHGGGGGGGGGGSSGGGGSHR